MTATPTRRAGRQLVASRARAITPVLIVVALMWLVELVDYVAPVNLDYFGIRPRELEGLIGIFTSPFLHVNFEHLVANTSALLVLGTLLVLSTRHLWPVTLGVMVAGGFGVWVFGAPNTVIVGASGLVYGYAAFLMAYGFVARKLWQSLIGVLVAVSYWWLLWGVLPIQSGVSWQGHLFGAVVGFVLAVRLGQHDRLAGGALR